MTDQQFKSNYRMSKESFHALHSIIEGEMLNPMQERRGGNHSGSPISTKVQLLAVLRYYATGSIQVVSGDLHGLSQPYISRLVRHVSQLLAVKGKDVIRFPSSPQRLNEIKAGFKQIANFPNVIGLIDCTHIPVRVPSTAGSRNAFYNRKGYYSLNVQFVVDHEMRITNLVCRWPGSNHDSIIFRRSRLAHQLNDNPPNGYLLGDSGYTQRNFFLPFFLFFLSMLIL